MSPDGHSGTREHGRLSPETVLGELPDAVYVVDTAGRLLDWNAALAALTGYDDDRLSSLSLPDLLSTPASPAGDPSSARNRRPDGGAFRATVATAAGEGVPCEVRERALLGDDGVEVGRCGVARPVGAVPRTDADRRPPDDTIRDDTSQSSVHPGRQSDCAGILVTHTGGVLTWDDGASRLLGYRRDEVVGRHLSVFFGPVDGDDGENSEEGGDAGAEAGVSDRLLATAEADGYAEFEGRCVRADGSRFWAEVVVTAIDDRRHRAFTMVIRDTTRRRERELSIRRQRDELETLNRIASLAQELVQQVVETSTHESIEQTVCRRLTDSAFYRFAAVGEPEFGDRRFTIRAAAGDDGGAHEAVVAAANERGLTLPAVEAFHTGQCIAVSSIATAPEVAEPLRVAAVEHGVQAAIAVPLSFGDTVYGVLLVYADSPDAFTEHERAAFEALGRTVGFAMNAGRNRDLLFADSVVELEFRSTDRSSFFVDLSLRYDCRCHLDGQVLASDDRVVQYVRVSGIPPEVVLESAESHDEFHTARLVTADDDTSVLEVSVSESGLKTLLETGAHVRSAVAEGGVATVVADIAKGEHVRSVVQAFQSVYPESTLVSKRERDRPTQSPAEFRRRLAGQLTTRQQAALEAAYLAGYFDWPRESTAEEVAAAMDISSATLHYHLRHAQHELVETYLDETGA
jgi:hypothetical protein